MIDPNDVKYNPVYAAATLLNPKMIKGNLLESVKEIISTCREQSGIRYKCR